MAEKQPDFVVSDRRRFGSEGELRPDAKTPEEEKPAATSAATPTAPPSGSASAKTPQAGSPAGQQEQEIPEPPTAEEEQQQQQAYKASGKKIDDLIAASGKGSSQQGPMEMSFERVVESFYMSALIQMGAFRQEGESPRIDIIGARQTIDSLDILQEKTKGNLTDREKTLLQNVLFELRMAWIEITNAVATSAAKPAPGMAPPTEKK